MYVYIWEYRVGPETVERFREVYGLEGAWVALFRRVSGYVGTQLYRDLDDPYRFVTVDTWDSRDAYGCLRRRLSAEFEQLDEECESLTLRENWLGQFSVP